MDMYWSNEPVKPRDFFLSFFFQKYVNLVRSDDALIAQKFDFKWKKSYLRETTEV